MKNKNKVLFFIVGITFLLISLNLASSLLECPDPVQQSDIPCQVTTDFMNCSGSAIVNILPNGNIKKSIFE